MSRLRLSTTAKPQAAITGVPPVPLPNMVRLRQHFQRPRVDDIPATVRSSLERLDLGRTIKAGQTVALTAGSRGIANIPLVLRSVTQFLKDLGAKPFLVP